MSQEQQYKYFAFISYNYQDTKWGKRLQKKLEGYRMPATLCSEHGWNRKPIKPVFFAPTDIQPGGLTVELQERLKVSRHLIVICSPNSAKSEWVGEEIAYFHSLGRTDNIHFFIVDGVPHSGNEETECFNPIVKTLGIPEILGANIHEKVYRWPWLNKERAYVQLITKLLGVEFDSIWQRHKRMLIRKCVEWTVGALVVIAAICCMWKISQSAVQGHESRIIAEKALQLAEEGDVYLAKLLLLNTIPQNLKHPERPLTAESVSALAGIFDKETGILRGHTSEVYLEAYSPDGKTIISSDLTNRFRIWDALTGKCLWTQLGHSLKYSPDGKAIVSVSFDTVRIWNSITGNPVCPPLPHREMVTSASYSPDGKTIVSTSGNKAMIWNAITGKQICPPLPHKERVTSASYSPDGKTIVTDSKSEVKMWDVLTGKCLWSQSGHSPKFSPDGKTIVAVSSDSTAKIWDAKTGKQINLPLQHKNYVRSVSYSPDGKTIATTSIDSTASLWDATTGKRLDHKGGIKSVVFSPNGKKVVAVSYDKTMRIWDVEESSGTMWKTLSRKAGQVCSLPKRPNSKIAVTKDNQNYLFWDVSTGKYLNTLLAPVFLAKISGTSTDHGMMTFRNKSGECCHNLADFHLLCGTYSTNGKTIVIPIQGIVVFCDASMSLKENQPILAGHRNLVYSAAYSPDGKTIVTASADSTARIWNASTRKHIRPLRGRNGHSHKGSVYSAEYSNNGKFVVTTSCDGTIKLWKSTGKFLRDLTRYNAETASFSPDDKNIITKSYDGEIRIWDVSSGGCLKIMNDISKPQGVRVVSASYSPDGKSIVVILSDGTAMIRKAPPTFQEMLEITRKRFQNRELTSEEKKRFLFGVMELDIR